jgi:hypothetical protein
VLDRRRETPFALEPLAELPVLGQVRRKKLQRPKLPELFMASPVDHAHPAFAEPFFDPMPDDRGPDHCVNPHEAEP